MVFYFVYIFAFFFPQRRAEWIIFFWLASKKTIRRPDAARTYLPATLRVTRDANAQRKIGQGNGFFSDHLRRSVPRYIFSKINGLSRRLEVGPLNSTRVSVRFGPLQRYDPLGTSVSRTPGPLPRVRNGSVVLGPRWLLVGASAR